MKRVYQVLGLAIAVVLFIWSISRAFSGVDLSTFLANISFAGLVTSLIIGSIVFFTTGLLMNTVFSDHYGLRLSFADILMLPSMMHLWTYILPVKGGLLFQMLFMRVKYKIDLSKGFSVGVLIFACALLVTCLVGGLLSLKVEKAIMFRVVLGFMGLTLVMPIVVLKFVPKPNLNPNIPFYKIFEFLFEVARQLDLQLNNSKLLVKTCLVTAVSAFFQAFWFYHTAVILGYNPDLIGVMLTSFVLRIILLFRFLPGNLGIQELVTGTLFTAVGLTLQEGLMIAVFIRTVSLMVGLLYGIPGLYANFRYFEARSLLEVWNKVRAQNS